MGKCLNGSQQNTEDPLGGATTFHASHAAEIALLQTQVAGLTEQLETSRKAAYEKGEEIRRVEAECDAAKERARAAEAECEAQRAEREAVCAGP